MRAEFADSLELLRRAHGGDGAALEALLVRYEERLLERIRLMMGDEARARAESLDVLQGALLEALQHFDRFEAQGERAFLRWMTTIARNNIRDAARRRREQAIESLSASLDESSRTPSPSSEADGNDRAFRLAEALEELDPELRRVIELRDLEGLAFRAIGEALGCNEDKARTLHRKALVRLGARLQSLAR